MIGTFTNLIKNVQMYIQPSFISETKVWMLGVALLAEIGLLHMNKYPKILSCMKTLNIWKYQFIIIRPGTIALREIRTNNACQNHKNSQVYETIYEILYLFLGSFRPTREFFTHWDTNITDEGLCSIILSVFIPRLFPIPIFINFFLIRTCCMW